MQGLQVSISAESSSLTCHHLDIPNTTERNVVVGQEGGQEGRTGTSETTAAHLGHQPEHTSGYLQPPQPPQYRTQIVLIIFSIIAWLRVLYYVDL